MISAVKWYSPNILSLHFSWSSRIFLWILSRGIRDTCGFMKDLNASSTSKYISLTYSNSSRYQEPGFLLCSSTMLQYHLSWNFCSSEAQLSPQLALSSRDASNCLLFCSFIACSLRLSASAFMCSRLPLPHLAGNACQLVCFSWWTSARTAPDTTQAVVFPLLHLNFCSFDYRVIWSITACGSCQLFWD